MHKTQYEAREPTMTKTRESEKRKAYEREKLMQQEQSPSGIVPTIPTIHYISLNILQKPEQDHTFGSWYIHCSSL